MRRLTTTVSTVLVGVLLMTGCAPGDEDVPTDPAAIGWEDREAAVADVLEETPCDDARLFQGDPYSQDKMYGFGCYDANGTPLHFRIYQGEGSAQNVVAEWKGLVTAEYQVALGADWFAVGAPDTLAALAGIPQLDSAKRFTEAPPAASPISDSEMKQQICISYVTSAVEMAAEDPDALADVEDLDQMYPEMSSLILETNGDVQSALGSDAPDSMDVLSAISEHWQSISDYCEESAQGVQFVGGEED